jgi:mRNA interferase RelE/StbE
MAYSLRIRRSAEKEIAGIPQKIRAKIIDTIRNLAGQPRPYGCKKLSGEDRAWRIRVGDYRVIYEVDDLELRVDIRVVAHRKEAYR